MQLPDYSSDSNSGFNLTYYRHDKLLRAKTHHFATVRLIMQIIIIFSFCTDGSCKTAPKPTLPDSYS